MILAPFLCLALAIDGDTIACRNGPHARVAGVEANELHGGCHLNACPAMPGPDARRVMSRLVDGKTLHCEAVGRSFKRLVAVCTLPDGRDLRCALVASGAAVDWPGYVRRYRLVRC